MSDSQQMQMNVVVSLDEAQFTAPHEALPPMDMPILPLRDIVMFPKAVMPVNLSQKAASKVVLNAEKKSTPITVATFVGREVDDPQLSDIYQVGCAVRVVKVIHNPIMGTIALLIGIERVHIQSITSTKPVVMGHVVPLPEVAPPTEDNEYKTMYKTLVERAELFAKYSEHQFNIDMIQSLSAGGGSNPMLINFLCSHVEATAQERMDLLCQNDAKERITRLLRLMDVTIKQGELKEDILRRTSQKIDTQQRKYFLHEQMRQIEKELGDGQASNQANALREKAAGKQWPDKVAELFETEVSKLATSDRHSFEFNMQLNYLENLVNLPWGNISKDKLNLKHAQRVLDGDHYGLQKVKERIIEHLAILKLKSETSVDAQKAPILCLVGPPGVGKTSLGRSIARALGRKYVRMSLGGVHDESEIRGHRRTYVGAMPGRIIKGLLKVGTDNPVFVLDEIDKVGGYSNHGDPSSAMLEVLDPEQNVAFHDNYLDVDYDLSRVMFIATANTTSTIPAPLLDRMEIIEMSGYVMEEKVEIARRHLIDKVKEECGLTNQTIKVAKPVLQHIINNYTRESGVRSLEKQIGKMMRKLAVKTASEPSCDSDEVSIKTIEQLEDLIGKPDYVREDYQGNDYAGVVTGLAWTQVGGEILFIETSLSRGKGDRLTLTGNLGDVMKESATIALEYIKAHAETLGIDQRIFANYNIHIHVPEGATPKDGPSAGITMITSIVSALTQRKVRSSLAMTGEITLRGKILPVGGIKEKILAAKRAGISTIMLCEDNRRNVEKIEPLYIKGLKFHYVDNIADALDFALLNERVAKPVVFRFDESETPK